MPRPPSLARGDASPLQRAVARAQEMQPMLTELRMADITGWYSLANALNARGHRSLRGGLWTGSQLRVLMLRLEGDE